MPCFSPLRAFRTAEGAMTFHRSRSLSGIAVMLPCGQCVGCRLERSRQWAMRCMHEKRLHRDNCFVTLTYDAAHLPPGGTLVKRDLVLFMKRLRKERAPGVRFYACGEYGELNGRPHYHAILFNCDFGDKVFHSQNGRGDKLFVSAELRRLWAAGHCVLGECTFDSAAYVARYVMKKVTGAGAEKHYAVMDGDGVVYDRLPEFTLMSRRPGIGSGYYDRFGHEVRDHDSVVVNCREVRPPRFYDTRTERCYPAMFDLIRKKRRREAASLRLDNTVERLRVKEVIAVRSLQEKGRTL